MTTAKHPNLLIKYSFPLNDSHTKQISVGFDCKTLNLNLLLQSFTRLEFIKCTASDYYALFLIEKKVQEFFKKNNIENESIDSDNQKNKKLKLRLDTRNIIKQSDGNEQLLKTENITLLTFFDPATKRKFIVIQSTDEKRIAQILLNEFEWNRIISYAEIIKYHLFNYNYASLDVRNYYYVYRTKCIFKKCSFLEKSDMIRPYCQSNDLLFFNYSRLFLEIGLFCQEKIVKEMKTTLKHKT